MNKMLDKIEPYYNVLFSFIVGFAFGVIVMNLAVGL